MARFLIIFALFFSNPSFGQYLIRGIVYDDQGTPLPGVNVIEYKSDGQTVTNTDGHFILNCFKTPQTIVFSFVGFKSQEVIADTAQFVKVTLQPADQIVESEAIYCVFYNRHSKIGLGSGFRYTPLGLRIENFTPYIFAISTMLTTGIELRTNNSDNQYLDVFLRRYNIVRLSKSRISLFGEFKKITTVPTEINEFTISPDLSFRKLRLSLGYTYQKATNNELESKGNGIYLAAYTYLLGHLGIDLKTKFVLDNFQHDFKLYWDFEKPNITTGLGYERMGSLDEVTATIQYRLSY